MKDPAWLLPKVPVRHRHRGECHGEKGWAEVGGEGREGENDTLLTNLSSISQNSSLLAESKMKSSWNQKSECQKRTQGEPSPRFARSAWGR